MNEKLQERGEQLQAAAAQVRGGLSDRLSDLSGAIMIKAVIIAVLGICVLIWPATAFSVLLFAVAALLILDGIVGLVSVFRTSERGAFLGQSILSIVIGGILLLWPAATSRTLMLVLGAWALLHGLMLLWSLRELPKDDSYRSTQMTVGIVLAVIGGILLLWPGAGIVTLSWVLGIGALIIAAVLFWLAQRMRRVKNRVDGEVT
jgi:uncharacterized membrane protein HdeD (DUF308 family)